MAAPNPRLQRTRMRAPLSRKPFGGPKYRNGWLTGPLVPGVLLALASACSSVTPLKVEPASADLTVRTITPGPGSELVGTSEIDATVEYTISNFQPIRDRYYLSIQFENANLGWFNHYRRFADEAVLRSAHGVVHVNYAMSNVWGDPRLRKPIRVWFFLIERGEHLRPIGRKGPFEYS